jgi:hypothetical protein
VSLIDDFAIRYPGATQKRAGETYVSAEMARRLIDEAEAGGVGILGMEGFIIDDATYPALSRIADFSNDLVRADFVPKSCGEARKLLSGPWRSTPAGANDQIHPDARGRHMIAFVLHEPPTPGRDQ